MFSLMDSEMVSLLAHDNIIDSLDKVTNMLEKPLPSTITLKKNMFIDLIRGNYSIDDGLVNGAEGLFRHYTQGNPDFIWIEFPDVKIGLKERRKMQHIFRPNIKYE